MRLTYISF
jgi:hypothetical protein